MRTTFVVGEAGLWGALGILAAANAIAIASAISVSAVSTNMQVRGGGAYFLISRVLGPEFGGAIGLVFFIALALNIALNVLGFAEALVATWPALAPYYLYAVLIAAGALFIVALLGAGWSIKLQYVILGLLVLSLLAMFGGLLLHFSPSMLAANLAPHYTPRPGVQPASMYSFWLVFAIFFPAATGFLAGVNMSGDLRDPMHSIPKGTIAAVLGGMVIYGLLMLLSAGVISRGLLVNQPFAVLQNRALWGMGLLVTAGVFAATLSTALGSYLGAPRVLQAVARDRLLPLLKPFAAGSGSADEPRRALWLTGLIAVAVLVGAGLARTGNSFNLVASGIAMVFLWTYGMLNLAAFIEGVTRNPSFRPQFKLYHWSISLLGFLGCATAALLINALMASLAAIAIALLCWFLLKRHLQVRFGDAWWGFAYAQARSWLLRLEVEDHALDAKNWRPTILAFIDTPQTSANLASYAAWLEAGRGIVQLVNVVKGNPLADTQLQLRARGQLDNLIHTSGIHAFPLAVVSPDIAQGIASALQMASIGPIHPNLALMPWPGLDGKQAEHGQYIYVASQLGMSIAQLHTSDLPDLSPGKRIDVWWRGRKNGALMLLLAHLLRQNWEWAEAQIRLIRLISDEDGRQPAQEALAKLVNQARIHAEARVLVSPRPFVEVLHDHSRPADCVLLGFEPPEAAQYDQWKAYYQTMIDGLTTALLVHSQAPTNILV